MSCLSLNEVKPCPTSVRELAGLDLLDWPKMIQRGGSPHQNWCMRTFSKQAIWIGNTKGRLTFNKAFWLQMEIH